MDALHDILCEVLGSNYCYFEPPADIDMKYPCIVYNHSNDLDDYADDIHYRSSRRYTITVIDDDPDSMIPSRLKDRLRYCTSDRNYASEGLNHFVYALYFNGPRIKEENDNG